MPDKPRLLLVDDDTVALQVLSKALAPFVRLRFARDGAEAIKAVEAELPDLVLLDVQMPGLNGMQVLKALRERPASARLPVILITSAADDALESSALDLGAQDFIRKPFQPQQVLDRIRALLRLSSLRGLASDAAPPAFGGRARILLVDDDPSAVEMLSAALKPIGAELRVAGDGEQALALMQGEVPDIVLLDAEMPRLDGYAVCQAMQEDPVLAQVPVAFVSVHADGSYETRSFAVGAADFMAKPFKPDVLRARVRKLLQQRRERDESLNAAATHWQELGERRVADLVAVASDAIVSLDAQGLVRLINRSACQLFGVSAERVLGQPADGVLPGWQALQAISGIVAAEGEHRRRGRPVRAVRLYQGDGRARSVEPIVFQQGEDAARLTTVILRDATDRIAAEQRRESHRDAVVASAAQLALLDALAEGERQTESLVALASGRTPLPPCAPELGEFDLLEALNGLRQTLAEACPGLAPVFAFPQRSVAVVGAATQFLPGFQRLLGCIDAPPGVSLPLEIACRVDEMVILELRLPESDVGVRWRSDSPGYRYALTQLCAGGAVADAAKESSAPEATVRRFRLLRPLMS